MKTREAGHIRLNPPFFSSRKYYFNQMRTQIAHVVNQFVKDHSYAKLIDYGSGNSPYKPLFQPHVEEYMTADLSENPDASVILNQDGTIPGLQNYFNIVLSTQVLEHVPDPDLYLAESRRVLKNDGILILSTHGYWMYHPDPADYWRWTSAGLQKIVRKAGFDILYFRGILGRNATGLQLFQDGFLFKMPRFCRPVWSVFMQFFISITDKLNSQKTVDNDACTFLVVAKAV